MTYTHYNFLIKAINLLNGHHSLVSPFKSLFLPKNIEIMTEIDVVWKIFKIFDNLLGSYVTVKSEQKLSIFQRIYQWTFVVAMLMMLILISSTIMEKLSDFSMVLQSAIMFQMYAFATILYIILMMHRKSVMKVLQWSKETQALDNVHMNQARLLLVKTIKRFVVFFGFGFFSLTFGTIIIGQILPEEMYSKFRPPLPYELPVKDRDNWTIYIITCSMHVFSVFYAQTFTCLYYSHFTTFGIIFYAYLNTILEDIKNVKSTFYSKQDDSMFKLKMNGIAEKYCQGLE